MTAKSYIFTSELTEEFCSDLLTLTCAMALGEESEFSSRWATEATVKVEAEAEIWRSWVV